MADIKTTWYFVTDTNGKICGQDPKKASEPASSSFYKDKDGKICYPLGTYVISEKSAPTGYLVNDEKEIVHVTEDGTDKLHVATYNEKVSNSDVIMRGGVKLAKIDNDLDEAYAQGDATLEGAEFTVYNQSQESVMVSGNEYGKGDGCIFPTDTMKTGHIIFSTLVMAAGAMKRQSSERTGNRQNLSMRLKDVLLKYLERSNVDDA